MGGPFDSLLQPMHDSPRPLWAIVDEHARTVWSGEANSPEMASGIAVDAGLMYYGTRYRAVRICDGRTYVLYPAGDGSDGIFDAYPEDPDA